jgi:hypothetical protein
MTGLDDDEQVYGRFRYDVNSRSGRSERGNPNAYDPWFIAVRGRRGLPHQRQPRAGRHRRRRAHRLPGARALRHRRLPVPSRRRARRPAAGGPLERRAVAWPSPAHPTGVEVEYDALGRLYSNLVPGLWRGSNGLGLPARFPRVASPHLRSGRSVSAPAASADHHRSAPCRHRRGRPDRLRGDRRLRLPPIDAPGDLPRLVLPPPSTRPMSTPSPPTPEPRHRRRRAHRRHEVRIGTDPRRADGDMARDNDGDGLTNYQETQGWNVAFISTDGELVLCKPNAYTVAHADCRIVPSTTSSPPRRASSARSPRRPAEGGASCRGRRTPCSRHRTRRRSRTLTADDIAEAARRQRRRGHERSTEYLRNGQRCPTPPPTRTASTPAGTA